MTSLPTIEARRLSLTTRAGCVYRDVTLTVPESALALVIGPARTGKTALLLTLAGRMIPSAGEVRVAGHARPAAIRRLVGLAEFHGVNDLDETLTVRDQVLAELALHGRHWRGARLEPVLTPTGLRLDPHATISELGAADRILLGAALGLIGEPRVLVVDELDEDATPEERARVLSGLRRLTNAGTTVVAGALDPLLALEADVAFHTDGDELPTFPPRPREVIHALT